jgi:hypothetical protein
MAHLKSDENAHHSLFAHNLKHILTQTEATSIHCYPSAHHISRATRLATRLGVRLHVNHTPPWWVLKPKGSLLAGFGPIIHHAALLTILYPELILVPPSSPLRSDIRKGLYLGAET